MIIHNGTNSTKEPASTPVRGRWHSFAAALAVIALAGVAIGFFAFRKTGTGPEKTGPVPETAEAANAGKLLAPNDPGDSGGSSDPSTASEKTGSVPIVAPGEKEGPVPDVSTVSPADETGTDPEIAEPEEEKPVKKSPYRSHTEVLLSMLNSVPPGIPPPPLPISIDDDLEADADKAATNVIEITEDDDEHAAAHKENVGWDKLDLQEMRKEGWTAAEFIKALEAERNENASFYRDRVKEFEELLNDPEATDDDCYAVYDEINKELAERGLPLLHLPVEGDDDDE